MQMGVRNSCFSYRREQEDLELILIQLILSFCMIVIGIHRSDNKSDCLYCVHGFWEAFLLILAFACSCVFPSSDGSASDGSCSSHRSKEESIRLSINH